MSRQLRPLGPATCGVLFALALLVSAGATAATATGEADLPDRMAKPAPSGDQTDAQPADGPRIYSLDDYIITTTRRKTRKQDTTVPVDVLDRDKMDELLPLAIGDLVSETPGMSSVKPSGAYFQNPSIRGLGGRRVVILVDGRRIDTEKTMGVTGYFVDLANVERVELVRGPGSVLYGSDAIGGVINVITVDPLSRDGLTAHYGLSTEVNAGLISNDLRVGWGGERFAVEASGRHRDAGDYETGGGDVIDFSGYTDTTLGLKLAWRPSEHHTLRLSGDVFFGEDLGKAANELDDEKHRRVHFPQDRHYMGRLAYDGSELSDVVRGVHLSVWADMTDRLQRTRIWNDLEVLPNYLTAIVEKQGDFRVFGGTGYVTLRPMAGNMLTVGVDGSFKMMEQDQTNWAVVGGDTKPPVRTPILDETSMWTAGVFAQDEHELGRRWRLLAGLRWDGTGGSFSLEGTPSESVFDNAVSGNLGALYRPSRDMSLSLNLGRAFRAPTAKEKFLVIDSCKGRLRGNTDVLPEHSFNVDLGWKGRWGYLTYELYLFNIIIQDYITLAPSDEPDTYDYTNIGLAWLIGGESRLGLDFPRLMGPVSLRVWTSLSYVRAEDLESNEPLAQIPPLGVRAGVRLYGEQLPSIRSFFLDLSVRYAADQDRVSPSGSVGAEAEAVTGAYLTAYASFGLRFAPGDLGVTPGMFVRVENLSNTNYRDHLSSIDAMGRTVQLGLTLDYD